MANSKIKIFAAIIALALTGAAFWFFLYSDTETFKSLNFKSLNTEIFKSLNPEDQPDSAKFQRGDLSEPISTNFNEFQEYTNSKYSFSFSHPKEFSATETDDGFGYTVLVQPLASDPRADQRQISGFQVYITPFDEPGPITKERILKDIPDMAISDDKYINIDGINALSFKSKDASLETQEIWFVHSGNLYQISAFPSFEKQLEKILETWKWD